MSCNSHWNWLVCNCPKICFLPNVSNCPVGNCLVGNCPGRQLSQKCVFHFWSAIVRSAIVWSAIVPKYVFHFWSAIVRSAIVWSAIVWSAIVPVGNCLGRQLSGRQKSVGNCPVGNCWSAIVCEPN